MKLPAFNGRCAIMVIKVKGRERLSVCNGHWAIWSGPLLQPLLEAAFAALPPGHRYEDLEAFGWSRGLLDLPLPDRRLKHIERDGAECPSSDGTMMQPLTHGYAVSPDYLSPFEEHSHQLYGDPRGGPLEPMLLVRDGQTVGALMGMRT